MKKRNFIPALIFLIISVAYAFYIFRNISYWGRFDWDQFTFWNAVARETIAEYRQFPLWNPYGNGGNILLAHPDSPFLSPLYVFVLIFGSVVGLKLQIIAHVFIGLCGMFLLSLHMKIEKGPAYLSAFVYMLGSFYALHVAEGQMEWLALAFVPWVFLYYLKSFNERKSLLLAVLFFGVMLVSGVYVVSIFAAFLSVYALLKSVQLRNGVPVKTLIMVFGGAILLCAVKLFPMLEFMFQNPRFIDEPGGMNLMTLYNALLSRQQAFLNDYVLSWSSAMKMGLDYQWHEYGAYVGVIPILLFFCGVVRKARERWPLIVTGLIFLFISMGNESPVNLWKIMHSLPVYSSLHVPSRFIFGFVFSVALLSGWGLMFLEKIVSGVKNKTKIPLGTCVSFSIVAIVLFDLLLVTAPVFKDVFRIVPLKVERNATFRQRYQDENFLKYEMIKSFPCHLSYSSMYPIFLSNSGILGSYEVVGIKRGDVRTVLDPDYRGEVYLAGDNGKVLVEYFSPNKLIIDVDIQEQDVLVINQNYYPGWRVKKDGKILRAGAFNGLIADPVLPGRHKITFFYMPLSFLVGLFVSVSFILSAAMLYRGVGKK